MTNFTSEFGIRYDEWLQKAAILNNFKTTNKPLFIYTYNGLGVCAAEWLGIKTSSSGYFYEFKINRGDYDTAYLNVIKAHILACFQHTEYGLDKYKNDLGIPLDDDDYLLIIANDTGIIHPTSQSATQNNDVTISTLIFEEIQKFTGPPVPTPAPTDPAGSEDDANLPILDPLPNLSEYYIESCVTGGGGTNYEKKLIDANVINNFILPYNQSCTENFLKVITGDHLKDSKISTVNDQCAILLAIAAYENAKAAGVAGKTPIGIACSSTLESSSPSDGGKRTIICATDGTKVILYRGNFEPWIKGDNPNPNPNPNPKISGELWVSYLMIQMLMDITGNTKNTKNTNNFTEITEDVDKIYSVSDVLKQDQDFFNKTYKLNPKPKLKNKEDKIFEYRKIEITLNEENKKELINAAINAMKSSSTGGGFFVKKTRKNRVNSKRTYKRKQRYSNNKRHGKTPRKSQRKHK